MDAVGTAVQRAARQPMRHTEQGGEARCRICAEQFRPAQTRWQTASNVCEAVRQSAATGRYPHRRAARLLCAGAGNKGERGMTRPDRIDSIDLSPAFLPLATPISDAKVLTGRQKPLTL